MGNLISKYLDNSISQAELLQLRTLIENSTDEELLVLLESETTEAETDLSGSPFTTDDILRLKHEILSRLEGKVHRQPFVRNVYHVLSRAAILLLPVFILSTWFFYHSSRVSRGEEVCVRTAGGERASVTLPDGTTVRLNARSRLIYRPTDFSGNHREVSFEGEGYFDVASQHGARFCVKGSDFHVTVLGTQFNLSSYADAPQVILSLEEGIVNFTSGNGGPDVTMQAGCVSVMDRSTGRITTSRPSSLRSYLAWKQDEIVFRHAPLSQVFSRLSQCYGVSFSFKLDPDTASAFTGVLPASDLNEALDIVEQLYQITCTIDGTEVHVK